MTSPDTPAPDPGQKRCPVCWRPFTPNNPSNPHPRRYCSGACRIEDSRRRRRDTSPPPAPAGSTDEYRYSPPPGHGPCPEHPHCILTKCARLLCPNTVHITIQAGQPRRFCSPACRVAEHRRLN
jgi:hypothetical protein